MTAIDEIKARIDAVELIGETVKLRRTGRNYIGFCPFPPNTRTPAFVVFPESGTWRCFGACNEGGDIFKFLMKKEGWDFAETLRYLAERAGVPLEAPNPQRKAEDEEHERLRRLLEEAVTFDANTSRETRPGLPAKTWCTARHAGNLWAGICTRQLGCRPGAFYHQGLDHRRPDPNRVGDRTAGCQRCL
jgi:DNA primase